MRALTSTIIGLFAFIGGLGLIAFTFFVTALLTTFFGTLTGFCVELVYPNTTAKFLLHLGLSGFSLWQIGGFLGFVGGFFAARVTTKDSKD